MRPAGSDILRVGVYPKVGCRTFWLQLAQLHTVSASTSEEGVLIGGQAVIEGVMMRAPHSYAVAVRAPSGQIVSEQAAIRKPSERYRWFGYPVLRGIGNLGQALQLGLRALRFSANTAVAHEAGREKQAEISPGVMAVNLAVSIGLFVLLYKFVPLYLATLAGKWLPALQGRIMLNLTDGLLRILIFLGFVYGISRWKEIARVFEYHGAEHQTVANFESGLPVSVENARGFPRFHPRCGTSFLLVVMIVAIGVYALIPFESFGSRLLARVLLLPVIVGVSYEVIRMAALGTSRLLVVLTWPGLWLQRITTRPPADDQLEVAVRALTEAMELEASQGGRLVIA